MVCPATGHRRRGLMLAALALASCGGRPSAELTLTNVHGPVLVRWPGVPVATPASAAGISHYVGTGEVSFRVRIEGRWYEGRFKARGGESWLLDVGRRRVYREGGQREGVALRAVAEEGS